MTKNLLVYPVLQNSTNIVKKKSRIVSVELRPSYSLCDKFNLYRSDQSLCPLCLCGSFHALTSRTVF
ncbi:MAG: hypothetical protein EWV60_09100 [Microcystis sp. Msp_OC_L_20101000_S702]|uniref:Uncharacterized protein n=1 Tax=Microcystis aeruginosa Ma_QC_B_20070730_S2 TaxID=2486256 RepID=A0A552DW91_MICAE|nr:MAG: hypothetical protein EWV60_09100 [Microcystis sp. Msp_OC_L_20101000_S702]TRU26431.1 MAG: hypothetical protein EWV80_08375 [Microcystis aeruginosa Ma_QC_B_20070730_S2]